MIACMCAKNVIIIYTHYIEKQDRIQTAVKQLAVTVSLVSIVVVVCTSSWLKCNRIFLRVFAVNNGQFEYRKKDKFTSGLFLISGNDFFTTVTTKWKPGFNICVCNFRSGCHRHCCSIFKLSFARFDNNKNEYSLAFECLPFIEIFRTLWNPNDSYWKLNTVSWECNKRVPFIHFEEPTSVPDRI